MRDLWVLSPGSGVTYSKTDCLQPPSSQTTPEACGGLSSTRFACQSPCVAKMLPSFLHNRIALDATVCGQAERPSAPPQPASGWSRRLRELHVEYRMQLDPVRGDAALAVDVVEEADPRDPHE